MNDAAYVVNPEEFALLNTEISKTKIEAAKPAGEDKKSAIEKTTPT